MASIVSKRYAAAFFDLAKERNSVDAYLAELTELSALWQENAGMREFLARPDIAETQKEAFWNGMEGLSADTKNLMKLLTRKKRLGAFEEIVRDYEILLKEEKQETTAQVISAIPLSDSARAQLKSSLEKKLGKTVTLEETVDAKVLGGLIVNVDGKQFDSSLKTRVEKLRADICKSKLDPS